MLLCAHHWTRRIGNWKRKEISSANLITSIGSINVCGVGGGGWYHSIHCGSGRTNKPHSSQLCSIICNTRNLNMLCFRSFTCDYYRRREVEEPRGCFLTWLNDRLVDCEMKVHCSETSSSDHRLMDIYKCYTYRCLNARFPFRIWPQFTLLRLLPHS